MPSWSDRISNTSSQIMSGQQSSPPDEPIGDADDPPYDGPPSNDESRRIVEEAIRRIEEAEHEWDHSWEPEKPAE